MSHEDIFRHIQHSFAKRAVDASGIFLVTGLHYDTVLFEITQTRMESGVLSSARDTCIQIIDGSVTQIEILPVGIDTGGSGVTFSGARSNPLLSATVLIN